MLFNHGFLNRFGLAAALLALDDVDQAEPCGWGTWQGAEGASSATECVACPEGSYCPPGSEGIEKCPPGFACHRADERVRGAWAHIYSLACFVPLLMVLFCANVMHDTEGAKETKRMKAEKRGRAKSATRQ